MRVGFRSGFDVVVMPPSAWSVGAMVRGVMVRGMFDPVRMGLRLRGLFNTAVIPPSVWSVGVMIRGLFNTAVIPPTVWSVGVMVRGLFNTALIPPSVWSVHMRVGFMGVVWCCGDLIFCLGSEESLK